MKAMAPLGLIFCRSPSYHSQWRNRSRQIGRQTQTRRRHRGRWAEKREMKMSKAAVKSDLLAHQDLSVGTSEEECGWETKGREERYFGGKLKMKQE